MRLLLALLLLSASASFALQGDKILHRFEGSNDGCLPRAGLIADRAGNLYGTTYQCGGGASEGTVFQFSPPAAAGQDWTETILYSFVNFSDGQYPWAGLTADKSGNLYGTTWLGGSTGNGVVFELSPPATTGAAWTYHVIYNFGDANQPQSPQARVVFDEAGNLYGTTSYGGRGSCVDPGEPPYPCGAVYQLSPPSTPGADWTLTTIHSFAGYDGGTETGVTVGRGGVVYGTTVNGGSGKCGPQKAQKCGTVFELKPPASPGRSWKYRLIYSFQNLQDGMAPAGDLIVDRKGNLYGTTQYGGSGGGKAFQLTRPSAPGGSWTETVLHVFGRGRDGSEPWAGLLLDRRGNLYGTTAIGPGTGCFGGGCGVAFQLKPPASAGAAWTETILHTFAGGEDGALPFGLVIGKYGWIYGTTNVGGNSTQCGPDQIGCGTVFVLPH